MSSTPRTFHIGKQQAEAIIGFADSAFTYTQRTSQLRQYFEYMDLMYHREMLEADKRYTSCQETSGKVTPTKEDEFIVPVIMPQVLSGRAFLSATFLSSDPIFQPISDPEQIDAALMLGTLIADQAETWAWKRNLSMAFLDMLKYNVGAIECSWERKTVFSPEQAATKPPQAARKTIVQGNEILRWDLYNSYWDTRVPAAEVSEFGEFAGNIRMMSGVRYRKFISELPMEGLVKRNYDQSLTSRPSADSRNGMSRFYLPSLRKELVGVSGAEQDWELWWSSGIGGGNSHGSGRAIDGSYSGIYMVEKLYARIIPKQFMLDVPAENTPQIWKFYIVNGRWVVWAAPQNAAHDRIPVLFGQPMDDGLGYEGKSYAENLIPSQKMASKLWSAEIASTRRIITDRALYDPSRITARHVNNNNPSAKIPVRSVAYGARVIDGYHAIPYEDRALGTRINQASAIMGLSNSITGSNPVKQGQFVKGNKTNEQFQESMGASNQRDLDMALCIEDQLMTPLKEIIKLNILQYQDEQTLYSRDEDRMVKIDPVELRNSSVAFKIADGLIPPERRADSDLYMAAFNTIAQSDRLAAEYDLGSLFSYSMKTRGLPYLSRFQLSEQQKEARAAAEAQRQAQLTAAAESAKAEGQIAVNAAAPQQPQGEQ